jgi:hypothetical protein
MVNVSVAEPLVYLCISTMRGAEIVEPLGLTCLDHRSIIVPRLKTW